MMDEKEQRRKRLENRQQTEHKEHKKFLKRIASRKPRIVTNRNLKSTIRIREKMEDDTIQSRVGLNLNKKQNRHLPDIMDCLIADAHTYRYSIANLNKSHKVRMSVQDAKEYEIEEREIDGKKYKLKMVERVPVIVTLNVPEIASRCGISQNLVWDYLEAMEYYGLLERCKKAKVKGPAAALRIIGGFYFNNHLDTNLPIYFWRSTRPDINKILSSFTRKRYRKRKSLNVKVLKWQIH